MEIRRLVPADAASFQALRLAALQECPSAFSSSFEEECATPIATIAARFEPGSGRNLFGAFDGTQLVGMVGVGRESQHKLQHKAEIRAMYVAAAQRGRGVGKQLFLHALAFAESMEGVQQVNLVVTADNGAAIGMYQAQGFAAYGREPQALCVDGVLYDNVLMARPVTTA